MVRARFAWNSKPEPTSKKPTPPSSKNSTKSPAILTACCSPKLSRSTSSPLITSHGSASHQAIQISPRRLSTILWSAASARASNASRVSPRSASGDRYNPNYISSWTPSQWRSAASPTLHSAKASPMPMPTFPPANSPMGSATSASVPPDVFSHPTTSKGW